MATLPDVSSLGGRPIPSPQRGMASVSNAGAMGEALQVVGAEAQEFAALQLDREATAMAKERDALASDQIRALLYDPESGFANMSGGTAVSQRDAISRKIDDISEKAMDGLNGEARRKLESQIRSRVESAKNAVDTHTSSERKTWIDGASKARIESAYQDSLFNMGETEQSLNIIRAEILGQASPMRGGWSKERTELELQQATSKVYAGQVIRAANADPVAAMQYLRQHEGDMLPEDVVTLEGKLQPVLKEYLGRARGREAFYGVAPEYLSAIRSAESGGNDYAKNPLSSATGRYQFTAGTWSAMMKSHPELGLTADGRTDGGQQELAILAFTKDNAAALGNAGISTTNGNLYAAHFLGAGGAVSVLSQPDSAMVADHVGKGVVAANGFLDGMTVGDFRAWTARKAGGGTGYDAGAINKVLNIPDPDERRFALDEIGLRSAVLDGQRKAQLSAAQDSVFQMIEAGGSVNDLSLEDKQALGQDAMTSLRTYEKSSRAGVEITTDPATYLALRSMQSDSPGQFKSVNMMEYIDKLGREDFQQFVDAQKKPAGDVTAVAVSTLMTQAKNQMEAAGINLNAKPGTPAAKQVSAIQMQLVRWQDQVIKKTGAAPTQLETDQQVARMLIPVVVNPPGAMNEIEGMAFEVDAPAETLGQSDITINGTFYEQGRVAEAVAALEASGLPVDMDTLSEILGMVE